MLERVIENWLTSATERTFEMPFLHTLSAHGYTILHHTRHSAMELGKDVIAVDRDGVPCAFQLKTSSGARMTLNEWRSDVHPQLIDLVMGRIAHPSLENAGPHQAYVVSNKNLNEEVWRSINDWNAAQRGRGLPEVQTIVGGQLAKMVKEVISSVWPTELKDIRGFLELHLAEGASQLDVHALTRLLEHTLSLHADEAPSNSAARRNLSSSALVCAFSLASYAEAKNYYALLEGWTAYVATSLAVAERWNLPEHTWQASVELGLDAVERALDDLVREATERESLVEGDPLSDSLFVRPRSMLVAALIASRVLWTALDGQQETDGDASAAVKFAEEHSVPIQLLTEAQIPQVLATYWLISRAEPGRRAYGVLSALVRFLAERSHPERKGIPSPYFGVSDVVEHLLGISDRPIRETFNGQSYTLEGLMQLLARWGFRQDARFLWPAVSRVNSARMEFDEKWRYLLWRSEPGRFVTEVPTARQSWRLLQSRAADESGASLPVRLKQQPHFVPIFLIVYPHRLTSDAMRWMEGKVRSLGRIT